MSKVQVVPKRRKREGKTNYRKRIALLMSRQDRLVVRKSLKYTYAQIVRYDERGDKIVAQASTHELKKLGWKHSCSNMPAAYLAGVLLASKVKKSGELILDIGLNQSVRGSRLYAVAKGAIDGGLKINVSKNVMPSDERVRGQHIASFVSSLSGEALQKQYGAEIKKGNDPKNITKDVEALIKKVKG